VGSLPAPPWAVALRLGQLFLGLLGWGLGISLFIRSQLGLGPWDAFHFGAHVQTGITVGVASIVVGFLILVVNAAMGIRPGLGTVLNMVFIGLFTDLILPLVPDATSLAAGFGYYALALPLVGLSSGAYIGAGFGHGPRDGLMLALTIRSGWSVRRIRTLIEMAVLGAGWLMGGMVGIGTVITTLTIGHSVQWGLGVFGALPAGAPGRAAGAGLQRSWRRRRRAA
jgi:uncharacterized protein